MNPICFFSCEIDLASTQQARCKCNHVRSTYLMSILKQMQNEFSCKLVNSSDYIVEYSITNMFNPIDFFIIGYIIEASAEFSQAFSRNLYNYQAAISISSISQVNVFLFSFIISPLSSATRTTKLEAFMFSLTLISRT